MKSCPAKLSLIAAGALLALHTWAQGPVPMHVGQAAATAAPSVSTPPAAARAPASTTKPTDTSTTLAAWLPVAGQARSALAATEVRTVTAAGSVLVLVDGTVASAVSAQVHPPAPGFAYER